LVVGINRQRANLSTKAIDNSQIKPSRGVSGTFSARRYNFKSFAVRLAKLEKSRIALEQFAGNPFRVLRTLVVQGESRPLKRFIASAGRVSQFAIH